MALERLTTENWLDIREALQRRLKELTDANPVISEAKAERARKVNSLHESIDQIEDLIRIMKFEDEQLNF